MRYAACMRPVAVAVVLASAAVAAHAQPVEPLRNVVHLSASGSVEVAQDWLQMNLAATREGSDAATVHQQLQQVVNVAMRTLRPQVQGQALQVRSSGFGVYPRHGADGKIKGWQGRAELVVEGKDFARITQAAAQVANMQVAGIGFGLSKEGRAQVQSQAQTQAVEQFKTRAAQLASQWGFQSYVLREVHVNSQDGVGRPRMAAVRMASAPMSKQEMADPVPVEAGKEQVEVSVSGSVQLQ